MAKRTTKVTKCDPFDEAKLNTKLNTIHPYSVSITLSKNGATTLYESVFFDKKKRASDTFEEVKKTVKLKRFQELSKLSPRKVAKKRSKS